MKQKNTIAITDLSNITWAKFIVCDDNTAYKHLLKAKQLADEKHAPVPNDLDFELAVVALSLGNKKELKKYLSDYLETGNDPQKLKRAQEGLETLSSEENKRWHLSIGLAARYDDNALSLGEEIEKNLEADNQRKEDFSGLFSLYFDYNIFSKDNNSIVVSLEYFATFYKELENFDYQVINFNLDSTFYINESLSAQLNIGYQYILLGENGFRNSLNLSPELRYEFLKGNSLSVFYKFSYTNDLSNNFFVELDRTGSLHSVGLKYELSISDLTIGMLYSYTKNITKGGELDYQKNTFEISLDYSLPYGINIPFVFSYSNFSYDNETFFLLEEKRDDDFVKLFFGINKEINRNITIFWDYSFSYNISNLDEFDYDRNSTTLGILLKL